MAIQTISLALAFESCMGTGLRARYPESKASKSSLGPGPTLKSPSGEAFRKKENPGEYWHFYSDYKQSSTSSTGSRTAGRLSPAVKEPFQWLTGPGSLLLEEGMKILENLLRRVPCFGRLLRPLTFPVQ